MTQIRIVLEEENKLAERDRAVEEIAAAFRIPPVTDRPGWEPGTRFVLAIRTREQRCSRRSSES